ncbi:MAG TPA: GlsB/YeaQ/YmgE family stress response membrane protein, partial [Pirellulales bacterium]|nr:GlsB/YeaQ/YmgE family stress response membrane protein [Pirellulales bacterium]
TPGGVFAWIVVGLVAGWLAGLAMSGGGYGIIRDIILGLIGALVGGVASGFFIHGDAGFIGSIVIAALGACLVVGISRALIPGHRQL